MKKYFLFFFLLVAIRPCAAQWQMDSGLGPYQALAFCPDDTNFFVTLANVFNDTSAFLRRTPWAKALGDGRTWDGWTELDIIGPKHEILNVSSVMPAGNYLLAGNPNGTIYRTTDLGAHWTGTYVGAGHSMTASPPYIIASGPYGILRTTNSGDTWVSADSNLNFDAMSTLGHYIIGGTTYSTWRSTDSGLHWFQTSNYYSTLFAIVDSFIFAGGNALQRSTDSGATWSPVTVPGGVALSIAGWKNNLFVGTPNGVIISTNYGQTWSSVNDGFAMGGSGYSVYTLAVFDTLLYANINGLNGNANGWIGTFHRSISEMVKDTTSRVVQMPQTSDSIEIYPNPSLALVTIQSGGTSFLGVRVLNVLGENVLDVPNRNQSTITLDVSKLPSGTYFLQISMPWGITIRKIVKE